MSDQLIVERSGLEKKEKGELQAIISALGGTSTARARKSDLIDMIMELSGAAIGGGDDAPADGDAGPEAADGGEGPEADGGAEAGDQLALAVDGGDDDAGETAEAGDAIDGNGDGEPMGADAGHDGGDADDDGDADADDEQPAPRAERVGARQGGPRDQGGREQGSRDQGGRDQGSRDQGGQGPRGDRQANRSDRRNDRNDRNDRREGRHGGDQSNGPDTEPPADWELMLDAQGGGQGAGRPDQGEGGDDVDPSNRRSRRRGRGRGRDRDEVAFEPVSAEPIPVAGVLDLRDEGYGFLRVDGCLPSKDDVYVSVKQVRQFGLRKGDVLTGLSRPANRNEKNPGFHEIHTVNDLPAEEGRHRVRFDDQTPLFPDQRLRLEMREEPLNMTTRIIDLVAPIGKGQRALIVSPPKAGKTSVIKDIARAIETNNPEVRLIVLLLDERPEEVTDMSRHLTRGDVVASTFDRPPEEHCAVAELTIERAKRLVEAGEDVVMIVDGITRLARAYNLTVPPTGRSMSGGVDAGALYPPKRFFGAARNLEEGGSLTILATALVETGSRMDEVIFEEFKGTGNCEIRLDRRLADKRIYPAIDIDASSTRHEELLFDRQEQLVAWKLRRVLSGMKADDGSFGPAVEMLIDRLKSFRTNADFLNEIAKGPSL